MAEGDRFERAFRAAWRGAYRRTREGVAPPAEVADKLVEALAKTLRDSGGLPGLAEMREVVENGGWRLTQTSGAGEEAANLIESFNALDRIVRDQDGHRHTKVAAEVAKSLLVQQGPHGNDHGVWPMATSFLEDTCAALVEHHFFATARQKLVAEGKLADHARARQWQQRLEEAMQPGLRQVAARLVKAPNAKGLRAPNRTVKQQSTTNLLGEVLVSTKTPRRSPGTRGS